MKENPQPAIDALVGREYEFLGRKVRNTNLALIALAKVGISLAKIEERAFEAMPIVAYAITHKTAEVWSALSSAEGIVPVALEFCEDLSPEDLGEAMAIFRDSLLRFNRSMVSYSTEKGRAAQGESPLATDAATS